MSTPFTGFHGGMIAPASDAAIITPDDDNDLARAPRAIVVNDAVKVTTRDGATLVLPDPGGFWQWDLMVARVHASDTDATVIVALY